MSELQEAIRRLPVDWPDWTDVGISVSFSVPAEHLEVRRQLQRADSMRSLWPSLVSAVSCMEDTPSLCILVDTTCVFCPPAVPGHSGKSANWPSTLLTPPGLPPSRTHLPGLHSTTFSDPQLWLMHYLLRSCSPLPTLHRSLPASLDCKAFRMRLSSMPFIIDA